MAAILRSAVRKRGIDLRRLLMDSSHQASSQQLAREFTHSASTHNNIEHPILQFSRGHSSERTSRLILHIYRGMFRNISTMRGRPSLSPSSSSGKDQPVPSPLTMVPMPAGSSMATPVKEQVKRPVQAVLKKIKESPKKVNLVASLVRGMRVEDALMQLAVLQKRAAKTVKRVVANARANATHNHGLNGDRLYVAEAFVGKGKYLRRISIHAKGRSGIMHHPSCRLTVIVKELSEEQENEIARYKSMTFRERAKVKSKLFPHKLIEVSPQWNRRVKDSSQSMEA